MKKVFQTYLISGDPKSRREKTIEVLEESGVTLKKVSPDVFFLKPAKTLHSIDDVRTLKAHIYQKPLVLPFKVIIFEEAEKLTIEAQSALLKILEEPPTQAMIILEAQESGAFLATIKSRVIQIEVRAMQKSEEEVVDLFSGNLDETLEKISNIDNEFEFLNQLISKAYENILLKVEGRGKRTIEESVKVIETASGARRMIQANVNPKFVLINFLFSIHFS